MTPEPFEFLLLGLAAFRTWKLLAEDLVLDRPRSWLLDSRPRLEEFVSCSWCAGWWCAFGWWAAWWWIDEWAVAVAVPFALSALVGLTALTADRLSG